MLSKEDYEKIQMLAAIFNYAKYVLKDDSIADEAHRSALAIRRQEKYRGESSYGPVHGTATSNELQFANFEGAVDRYNYSDSKGKTIIQINKPLSKFAAQTTTNEWINYGDEAGVFGMVAEMFRAIADTGNFIGMILSQLNEKLNPLYGRVCEGDTTVYVKKEQPFKKSREYIFYFSEKDKKNFYYVKK